jgi:hypothetical protein
MVAQIARKAFDSPEWISEMKLDSSTVTERLALLKDPALLESGRGTG